jgi:hypothetical protein
MRAWVLLVLTACSSSSPAPNGVVLEADPAPYLCREVAINESTYVLEASINFPYDLGTQGVEVFWAIARSTW